MRGEERSRLRLKFSQCPTERAKNIPNNIYGDIFLADTGPFAREDFLYRHIRGFYRQCVKKISRHYRDISHFEEFQGDNITVWRGGGEDESDLLIRYSETGIE